MQNININPGGAIGAVLGLGIGAFVMFTFFEGSGIYRIIVLALIGGAIAGNLLWGAVFKKPDDGDAA